MDKKRYRIAGINFEIILNSKNYKLIDLFNEPEPYNLYINYYIEENDELEPDEIIIINDDKNNSLENTKNSLTINTDISKLVKKDYNYQFSLFGNKGIIQKYIIHILETKYNCILLHGCALINQNNEVIIGLGGSGSGKSVLINIAIQNGWKLIATEQTIIDMDMHIYKGNIFDNVSPLSKELIEEKLKSALILPDKRLIEPLGQKIFVDMSKYAITTDKIKIDLNKLTIINVNFNGQNESIMNIQDNDYLLRLLQISASEKISFPAIIKNELIAFPYLGNAPLRQKIINSLINSNSKKIILSNGFEGFNLYFNENGGIKK